MKEPPDQIHLNIDSRVSLSLIPKGVQNYFKVKAAQSQFHNC